MDIQKELKALPQSFRGLAYIRSKSDMLELVPSTWCDSMAQVTAAFDKALADGYEGVIVRDPRAKMDTDPLFAMKLKPFKDDEFLLKDIVDVVQNGLKVLCAVRNNPSIVFHASWYMPGARAIAMLKDKHKHIGSLVTAKYQQLLASGVPRHATIKGIAGGSANTYPAPPRGNLLTPDWGGAGYVSAPSPAGQKTPVKVTRMFDYSTRDPEAETDHSTSSG